MSGSLLLVASWTADETAALAAWLEGDLGPLVSAADPDAALTLLRTAPPSAILCDIESRAGIELLRALATSELNGRIPLLAITGPDDLVGRVVALELGADDAVSRPVSPREIALRLRALRRRTHEPPGPGVLRFGRLMVDPAAVRVAVGDREVHLSALERRLLLAIVSLAGSVASREWLHEELWGRPGGAGRTLDTTMKRLRRKLAGSGVTLATVRGAGFRIETDAATSR